jgi:hypothetical protein
MGDTVREYGGDVRIFSSQHVSGYALSIYLSISLSLSESSLFSLNLLSTFLFSEQLAKFTGIAAVLRFPFADVEEDEDDDLSFLDEDDKGKDPAVEE